MRYRLRTLLILAAVGPLVLAGIVCLPIVVWDGRFELNARLINETGKAIDHIEAADIPTRKLADLHVMYPQGEQPNWQAVSLDNQGVAPIDVNCSGHDSRFTGIELRYWQSEALLFRIHFMDGTRSLFAVSIPARGPQNFVVDIPAAK